MRGRLPRRLGRSPVSRREAGAAPSAWAILLTLLLASCATVPRGSAPPIDPELAWSDRRPQLQALPEWNLSGRISVTGPDGVWNARLQWTQHDDAYDIFFMTPFGQRIARLHGGRSGVVLDMPDQAPLQAATAGELLAASFGWSAPVEALRYWVLGAPQPRAAAATRLDEHGRLLQLEQDGWRIDYPQYTRVGGAVGELPRRLTMEGPPLRIRLVVDGWGLGE